MYVKFCNFGNYADEKALAAKQQLPSAQSTDVSRKVTLYRRLTVILLVLCVVLLAVLLALAVKLSEAQSSQQCPALMEEVEKMTVTEVCSRSVCEVMFPPKTFNYRIGNVGHGCSECGNGWLKFEDSCYLLSQTRLSWQESREKCQEMGGDLVVIPNERVQKFLTRKGHMMYWIGLSRSQSLEWIWINNTALIKGFWSSNPQDGDCVFLNGGRMPMGNWLSNPCTVYSQYICQKG